MKLPLCTAAAAVALTTHAAASIIVPVALPERVRGAERVVVASVAQVDAAFETNEFGDQLIVSQVTLQVEESLKGEPSSMLWFAVDGGTVGTITMEVSSIPKLRAGDRAVFFLKTDKKGRQVPHLRGQGIVKLDMQKDPAGAAKALGEIRKAAAEQR